MAFQIRYSTNVAGTVFTTLTVSPAPTKVEYPEKRHFEKKSTEDGATVIQRYAKDNRSRKWVWEKYRDSVPGYTALWNTISGLEVKSRLEAGLDPVVEILDSETGVGGLDTLTKVKIIRVDRTPRAGGGAIVYEESTIEFVIADDTYTGF